MPRQKENLNAPAVVLLPFLSFANQGNHGNSWEPPGIEAKGIGKPAVRAGAAEFGGIRIPGYQRIARWEKARAASCAPR